MGVYRRKDSPYYWLWLETRSGRPLVESTKIRVDAATVDQRKDNRKLADIRYHQRLADLSRGVLGLEDKPDSTFQKFSEWFEAHELPRRRGRDRELWALRPLRTFFGTWTLKAIDRAGVKEYFTARAATQVSANTINREIDLLKAIVKAAVPKYLTTSPLYGMPRFRVVKPKRHLLTPAEERRLLPKLAPDDRAFFLIGLDSLVRLSDILDLEWADLDLRARTAYVREPKDPTQEDPYTVPLSLRAVKALKRLPRDGKYVFARRRQAVTERDRRGGITQMLRRACAAASVTYGRTAGGVTFHWSTRRTGATRMLRAGSPLGAVQKLGNWADPEIVLTIYNEAMDADVRKAVELPARTPRLRGRKTGKKQARK